MRHTLFCLHFVSCPDLLVPRLPRCLHMPGFLNQLPKTSSSSADAQASEGSVSSPPPALGGGALGIDHRHLTKGVSIWSSHLRKGARPDLEPSLITRPLSHNCFLFPGAISSEVGKIVHLRTGWLCPLTVLCRSVKTTQNCKDFVPLQIITI